MNRNGRFIRTQYNVLEVLPDLKNVTAVVLSIVLLYYFFE